MEAAGVVVAVSPGAAGYTGALTVGDEVIVTVGSGGYADQVIADGSDVGHKPEVAELLRKPRGCCWSAAPRGTC